MKILIIGEKTKACDVIVEKVFQIYLKDAEFITQESKENDVHYAIYSDCEIPKTAKNQHIVHLNSKTGKYKEITSYEDLLPILDCDQKNLAQN
jgi:hypothetical protein